MYSLKIDAYSHIAPIKYKEALEKAGFQTPHFDRPPLYDMDERFRILDKYDGILQVITVGLPGAGNVGDKKKSLEIAKVANDNDIPLFAGDTGSVPRGAIMALGYNYYKTGYAAGEKATLILRGIKKPGEIPSTRVADIKDILEFHISVGNARAQGFNMPASLIERVRRTGGKVYE